MKACGTIEAGGAEKVSVVSVGANVDASGLDDVAGDSCTADAATLDSDTSLVAGMLGVVVLDSSVIVGYSGGSDASDASGASGSYH